MNNIGVSKEGFGKVGQGVVFILIALFLMNLQIVNNLKVLIFFTLLALTVPNVLLNKTKLNKDNFYLIVFLFILLPVISAINRADFLIEIFTPFLSIITMYFVAVSISRKEYFTIVFSAIFIVSQVYLVFLVILNFDPGNSWAIHYASFFSGSLDVSEHARVGLNLVSKMFTITSLLFLPAFVYYLYTNKLIKSLLILAVILLSFSRFSSVLAFIFLSFYMVEKMRGSSIINLIVLATGIYIIFQITIFNLYLESTLELFYSIGLDDGYSIREGHIESFMVYMNNNFVDFLIGIGGDGMRYSSGVNHKVLSVEVGPVALIMKYGFIFTLSYFLYMGYSIIILLKNNKKAEAYSILSIIFLSFSNSILLHPILTVLSVSVIEHKNLFNKDKSKVN